MASNTPTSGTGEDAGKIDFQLYRYDPSLPGAVAAVTIFAVATILHFKMIFQRKSYYFTAFAIGGIFEAVGYVGRAMSHFNKTGLIPFIMQSLLILLAPALFAASIYAILGRLIIALRATHIAPIKASYTTKIFVGGDVLSFFLQMAGGGLQAKGGLDMFDIGEKIILVGLFIQITFFGVFIVNAAVFHRRLFRQPPLLANIPWQRHLFVLYGVSVFILVRNIFRVVEYLQGNDGYLISNEIFLYIFDMALMAGVMVLFLIWYVDDLNPEAWKIDEGVALSEGLSEPIGGR
ncbi:hypothetical protein MAPG_09132 [Magnaporthiopsis poae ATCC 64411]|uniref:RTA1 domain-containing protein n=1 Tax=Magnaporthiopsis poae (strain ATCC 64411 / 73-15) TaxID=644358 RepID=A0A0C4E954_MAGP6|nr:hypothetical protein MAPG_09132 [Magnaporthiopsis poae ATCC 64411]